MRLVARLLLENLSLMTHRLTRIYTRTGDAGTTCIRTLARVESSRWYRRRLLEKANIQFASIRV